MLSMTHRASYENGQQSFIINFRDKENNGTCQYKNVSSLVLFSWTSRASYLERMDLRERLLSRRLPHFGGQQIVRQCRSKILAEGFLFDSDQVREDEIP